MEKYLTRGHDFGTERSELCTPGQPLLLISSTLTYIHAYSNRVLKKNERPVKDRN